jgi:hypothetical protein
VGIGVVTFVLAVLFPATSDDWARIAFSDRTPGGYVREALHSYASHNGRVLGNNLSFILMEPPWVRAAVKALTVTGLVAMMQVVVGRRSPWTALMCFVGVFLVPAGVFRQSYVWSAGFFNYVPPMIGLLHLVHLVGRETRPRPLSRSRRWLHGLGRALSGLATCLFIEHVAVAALVVAAAAGGAQLWRRQLRPGVPDWLAGAVVGCAVLFGSPGLAEVGSTDAYFSYADSVERFFNLGRANYSVITSSFVLSNVVLLALIAVGCLVSALRRRGQGGAGRAVDGAVVVGVLLIVGYAVVSRSLWGDSLLCGGRNCDSVVLGVDLLALFLLLAVLVTVGLRYISERQRTVWFVLIAATVLMLAPLLVVAPIGPRNVFGPTVTTATLAVLLAHHAFGGMTLPGRVIGRAVLAVVVIGGLTWHFQIHRANDAVARERVRILTEAVERGQHEVLIPSFPYPDWVHSNRDRKMGLVYYLRVPRDIEIDLE